jgi:hypothetical protein
MVLALAGRILFLGPVTHRRSLTTENHKVGFHAQQVFCRSDTATWRHGRQKDWYYWSYLKALVGRGENSVSIIMRLQLRVLVYLWIQLLRFFYPVA